MADLDQWRRDQDPSTVDDEKAPAAPAVEQAAPPVLTAPPAAATTTQRWHVALAAAIVLAIAGGFMLVRRVEPGRTPHRDRRCAHPRNRACQRSTGRPRGLRFDDAPVAADDIVGREGHGLLTLKLFQVTRTLLGGVAVGSADTALRLAASFVDARRLYGRPTTDMPVVREQLVAAYVDLIHRRGRVPDRRADTP